MLALPFKRHDTFPMSYYFGVQHFYNELHSFFNLASLLYTRIMTQPLLKVNQQLNNAMESTRNYRNV